MNKAKFVKDVTVIDPDTLGEVEVTIFKHPNGGMFGLDASYIEQELEEDNEITVDPFNVNESILLIWE